MRFVLTPFKAQGFVEHFTDKCGGVISWINQAASSLAFSEGWGLYAEMLIAEDTDSYQDQLWQRYGALKWRVGLLIITIIIIQVSYDHRSYKRNLCNCVWKPEKFRISTGFNV